jgi:hypothetical protein
MTKFIKRMSLSDKDYHKDKERTILPQTELEIKSLFLCTYSDYFMNMSGTYPFKVIKD